MPRLVRRKPLLERISTMLNPMDFLLWLSEEMETRDWDSKTAGTQLGIGLNFVFLVARANFGSSKPDDDIFGSDAGSSWISLIVGHQTLLHHRTPSLILVARFTPWFGALLSFR